MIIPHVTSCYNDTQDPQEESVPMCTMHNFPAMIEHCIEWGRDHFNEYFTDVITESKKLLEDPVLFYKDLAKEGNTTLQYQKLKFIKEHIEIVKSKNFDDVIKYAVKTFTDNYDHRIQQLLHNFPADYKNNDGSMFWTGSKRVPHPIHYDSKEELCFSFVKYYSTILGKALSIKCPSSNCDEYIKEISSKIEIPKFVPQNVVIKVNDTDPEDPNQSLKGDDDAKLKALIEELKQFLGLKSECGSLHPEDFEKDDDSNGHIDFIHACSNLRARNYTIQESDRQKTKMIAGKIIPAIATTTAAITGIVSLQLYTLLQTHEMTYMRNCFLNLAVSLFVLTEPAEKIVMKDKEYDEMLLGPVKAVPPNWTVWDHIDINKSMTVGEFIDLMKKDYNVDISVIACNNVTIVQTFMPNNKERYPLKIEDIYKQKSKIKLEDRQKFIY